MVKVIVAGAAGRMGSRIINMIDQNPDLTLSGAFESPGHPSIGMDAGHAAGIGDTGGISMVIGTTGIAGKGLEEVKSLAETIRCVMAPNMSVGMNVMFRMAGEMAKLLGDGFDIEIIEAHHRFKKDAQSGTAMRLAQVISDSVGRDLNEVAVYERKGIIGERSDKEIGIQTLRGGDITGDHTVMFAGTGERLDLTHRAHSRDNFARGALRAAAWVINQPKGLYDMQDVLGLKRL